MVKWVKRSTLRWFGHIERMGNEEFVKVYLSSVEGTNKRGRPLVRWEDRVREYVKETGVRGNALDWARRECMDGERWKTICRDVDPSVKGDRSVYVFGCESWRMTAGRKA